MGIEFFFRGLNDKGSFVHGSLISDYIISGTQQDRLIRVGDSVICMGDSSTLVDAKTVGQYTGINDKHGKMLFAGDLFKHDMHPNMIFRVWTSKGGFVTNTPVDMWQKDLLNEVRPFPCEPLCDDQNLSWLEGSFEIIGNIHQNMDIITTQLSEK